MFSSKRSEILLAKIRGGQEMTGREKVNLIVELSIPSILAQITSVLMFYIDASMVGSLGTEASAAIGLVEPASWLFGSLTAAASMGFAVQVAHFIGANDFVQARRVMKHSFLCCTLFSLVLMAVAAAISGQLPRWLGGGADILLCYYTVCRNEILAWRKDHTPFVWNPGYVREAWNIGAPMALQYVLMNGAQIVSTMIVAPLGNVSIAANSFAITAESLCYMPGYGIGDAASTLVGQTYGAGRRDLCRSFAWLTIGLGMGVMAVMGAVMYAFAPEMIGFLSPVPAIRSLGSEVLRIEAFAEPFFAASIVAFRVCIGAGDTFKPAVMNLASMWCVRLTLAYALAQHYGLRGVWIAMATELTFRGCIFLIRIARGSWMKGLK